MKRNKLIELARKAITDKDPSHDFNHAMRVLKNAELIAAKEGGDLKIIIPAALFHDAIVYPKNSLKSKYSAEDSAIIAGQILSKYYSRKQIAQIMEAIREHSFGIRPSSKESKIVQDADKLEYTGAIAVMRTFCSTGQMRRTFYHLTDAFCLNREPDSKQYALDLFYKKLLKAGDLMNTKTAKEMAGKRTEFLHCFLEQLKEELKK